LRYRIDLAYHGAGFHGWQRQPHLRTVQGELELWLARLLASAQRIAITGAGRTDAGVHATGMVAHFDADQVFDCDQLTMRLHAALPPDLVVSRISPAGQDFHARYSAIARTYEYAITNRRAPFGRDRVWFLPGPLDPTALEDAAAAVIGPHDFSGFCIAASRKEHGTCHVTHSEWRSHGDLLICRVRADRFLHMMVCLLVGTMVDVGRGRWSPDRVREILDTGDIRLCGGTAPAYGLTLVAVEYPGSSGQNPISIEIPQPGPFLGGAQ
jgi:tRNA pseudouridine38-40 synthase